MAVSNASPLKYTPSGIPRGIGSSGGIKQAPYLFRKIIELNFSSPFSVFTIQDYKSAYYCHLLFALLNPNIAYISANFAANVLEAMQILEREWQQLLADLDRGKISEKLELDPSVRSELEDILKPNPNRSRDLKIEFEQGLENIIPRIWPKLAYIGCITTGSMEIYKERLKFYAGKVPLYSHGYGASESWIGLNLEPETDRSAYTITPHAAFFEFIPIAEIDANNPTTIELTSLEINKIYEIVLTTVAGLYRYRLGDIVKCVGYYNKTPKIEYLYRRGSLLNLKGEKVSEDTVYTAITEATKSLGNNCKIVDYTTIMDYTSQPSKYIFYLEISQNLGSENELKLYRDKIEKIICDLNNSYRDKRKVNSIGSIELKLLKKDTFKNLKEKIIAERASESQFKMPRLLKQESLIQFLENYVINLQTLST